VLKLPPVLIMVVVVVVVVMVVVVVFIMSQLRWQAYIIPTRLNDIELSFHPVSFVVYSFKCSWCMGLWRSVLNALISSFLLRNLLMQPKW
jgi:hypothetical protein